MDLLSPEPSLRRGYCSELGTDQANDLKHGATLSSEFPFQGFIPQAVDRGVSLRQMRRVVDYAGRYCTGWYDLTPKGESRTAGAKLSMSWMNWYHLNDWVLNPACLKNQCSFVELLSPKKQAPNWYVSHWWGEAVADFMVCLERHVQVHAESLDMMYWVYAYAKRNPSGEFFEKSEVEMCSYFQNMRLIKGVLLVLDSAGPATPFKRAWCLFELAALLLDGEKGQGPAPVFRGEFDIVTTVGVIGKGSKKAELLTDSLARSDYGSSRASPEQAKIEREATFPVRIFQEGFHIDFEKSEASNDGDVSRVLNLLMGLELRATAYTFRVKARVRDHIKDISHRLSGIFAVAAWRVALEQKRGSMVQELCLPAVLAADSRRESLCLNFGFSRILDGDLMDITKAMNSHKSLLRKLTLDCTNCQQLSDDGLRTFSKCFPSLDGLSLCFSNCRKISCLGVAALAANIPTKLQDLELNFELCEKVGNAGVAVLAHSLPPTLRKVALHFRKTGVTSDVCGALREIMVAHDHEKCLAGQDSPGQYITVRDGLPVRHAPSGRRECQDEGVGTPLVELPLGTQLDVSQVMCDPETALVWGRISQPNGWALLVDAPGNCRWAVPDKPDVCGKYVVLRDQTPVGVDADRVGDGVGVLNKGAVVEVNKIKVSPKMSKVRGKLVKPPGWITLQSRDVGQRVAVQLVEVSEAQIEAAMKLQQRNESKAPLLDGIDRLKRVLQLKVGSIDEALAQLCPKLKPAGPSDTQDTHLKPSGPSDIQDTAGLSPVSLTVYQPGKYVIVQDTVTINDTPAPAVDSQVTLEFGQECEVTQVCQDENGKVTYGMVSSPTGWIPLCDLMTGERWASMVKDDACGTYTILCEGTQVDRTSNSIDTKPLETLSVKFLANVVKVVQDAELNKIRGKLSNPAGWITIVDLASGKRFAVLLSEATTRCDIESSASFAEPGEPVQHKNQNKMKLAQQRVKAFKPRKPFANSAPFLKSTKTAARAKPAKTKTHKTADGKAVPVPGKQLSAPGAPPIKKKGAVQSRSSPPAPVAEEQHVSTQQDCRLPCDILSDGALDEVSSRSPQLAAGSDSAGPSSVSLLGVGYDSEGALEFIAEDDISPLSVGCVGSRVSTSASRSGPGRMFGAASILKPSKTDFGTSRSTVGSSRSSMRRLLEGVDKRRSGKKGKCGCVVQ